MVAVGVGVDHDVDGPAAGDRIHGVEHPAGEAEVEEGVDEERRPVARQEPGVAPTPAAIGLEVGENPVGNLV